MARLQRGRIGAQAPDRGFPHRPRVDVEHQIQVDVAHQPGGMRELHRRAGRAPAGVSGQHARTWRGRRRREHPAQRRWVTSTGRDPPGFRGTRRRPAPSPIRIQPRSGSTGPPMHSGIPLPPTIGGSSLTIVVAGISVGRFSTRPKAPSGAKSQSSTTVRAKFGSWSCGIDNSSVGRKVPWSAAPRPGRASASDLGSNDLQVGDELFHRLARRLSSSRARRIDDG